MTKSRLFERVMKLLYHAKKVLIASPSPYDPDSIASCSLFHEYLSHRELGRPHDMYCPDSITQEGLYRFLPVHLFSNKLIDPPPDAILTADYGDFCTVKLPPELVKKAPVVIAFDHHDRPADDFPRHGIQVVDPHAASATVVIYNYLRYWGLEMTKNMYTYTAVGIYADTVGLVGPKTNAETLSIMNTCIEHGIPLEMLRKHANGFPIGQMRIWQDAFANVVYDPVCNVASLIVNQKKVAEWGMKNVLSLLTPLQALGDIAVVILAIAEPDDTWKISLRSNDSSISVAQIARELATTCGGRGGGHAEMAAVRWTNPDLNEALILIKERVRNIRARDSLAKYTP